MRFRSYDSLRLFEVVARHLSFTAAADELNLTKGAVSYQIKQLELELEFPVFVRQHRGVALTEKGTTLLSFARSAFHDVEAAITGLRGEQPERITIGMSTYFASRWLSPRLMTFMTTHPRVGLRLQPLVDLIDLRAHNIDMAIRWGKGDWTDMVIERLFPCPAFPTVGNSLARKITSSSLEEVLPNVPLLYDRDGSNAWCDWHKAAGLPYRASQDNLVIPDPNVRVQAVIDGQGMALNDGLIADELASGRLHKASAVELSNYGYYLAYPRESLDTPGLKVFRNWIMMEAC